VSDLTPDASRLELMDFTVRRGGRCVVNISRAAFGPGSHVVAGANGSGKSSLLLAIAGLLRSGGRARVGGVDVRSPQGRRVVAFLPQDPSGLDHLTPHQAMAYARRVSGRPPLDTSAFLDRVGLLSASHRPLRTLSAGQHRLAYLSMALCQEPHILLLDEPTTALDARHRILVRRAVREASLRRPAGGTGKSKPLAWDQALADAEGA